MKEKIFHDMEAKRKMKKKMRRLLALLAAMVLIVSLIPAAALAADEETGEEDTSTTTSYTVTAGSTTYTYSSEYIVVNDSEKTITVSQSGTEAGYEIQAAINYICNTYASNISADEQTSNPGSKTVDTSTGSEDGWTIIVESGTYSRFTVHSYLDYLTIEAADGAEVTINVLDGSSSPAGSSGGYPDVGGVSVRIADHVTLDGLTFSSSGDVSSVTSNYEWLASAVSDFVETTEKASNLVIKNCTFKGDGSEIGIMIAGAAAWEIDSCTFDNFSSAVSFMLDNTYTQAKITDNTITNCDDAVLESYAGGSVPDETNAYLTVTGNKIYGTASSHTRVCIMNEYKDNDSLGTVTISGNTFEHANILLDCINTSADAIYSANDIDECSWVLVTNFGHKTESITDDDKVVIFCASTDLGYWELTSEEGISEADLAYIKNLISTANKNGETTLTIDMTKLDLTGSSLSGYLSGGVKHLKKVLNWVTTTKVTVTKEWDDEDDADGIRPDSVTVELYQNGEATGKTLTLSEDNDWTATFDSWSEDYKGLPIHSEDGSTDYTYSVVETAISCYDTTYSDVTGSNEDGWAVTVTNTHEYVTVDVTVSKIWDDEDDADGIRPDSVTVELYADGEATGKTVTLSEENDWTATFEGLAAYSYDADCNASEISYSVAETEVEGYSSELTSVSFSLGTLSVTITNTLEETEKEPEPETEEETTEEETEEETTEEQTTEEETTEEVTAEEETTEEETTQTEETEETEEDTPVVGSTGFMVWMILLGAAALCVAVMITRKKITG